MCEKARRVAQRSRGCTRGVCILLSEAMGGPWQEWARLAGEGKSGRGPRFSCRRRGKSNYIEQLDVLTEGKSERWVRREGRITQAKTSKD